jgi:DNA-binding response OmpR family regulator
VRLADVRVLLCVPDPSLLEVLEESLHLEGYEVVACPNPTVLLARLGDPERRQVVILDYFASGLGAELPPGKQYIDLVARLAPLIVLMDGPSELRLHGQAVPVAATLPRPFAIEDLLSSIHAVDARLLGITR